MWSTFCSVSQTKYGSNKLKVYEITLLNVRKIILLPMQVGTHAYYINISTHHIKKKLILWISVKRWSPATAGKKFGNPTIDI